MTCAERWRGLCGAAALALVASCGGSSSQTQLVGPGLSGGTLDTASIDVPTGANTTQIVVDAGPQSGFSIGAVNVPYVSVSVCVPGSASACVTLDHVFLDTGSIGLRIFRSSVAALALPAITLPADGASATPAGAGAECYPFVLGAVWGALARADVHIGGETAAALPVQLIDDSTPPANAVPAECATAANGQLMDTPAALQANGILGVGMLALDCGSSCVVGNYASGYTLYYSCGSTAGSACVPAAVPAALQVGNPVAFFPVDNNGSIIVLPALPQLGAVQASGRLVFGIGTQSNNQLAPSARVLYVDPDPASPTYLYLSTTVGAITYPDSYIDSGSNALFFSDPGLAQGCQSSSGVSGSGWYCPPTVLQRQATLTDARATTAAVPFTLVSADALFTTPGLAFDDLAGTLAANTTSFVWGLPFFYGRSVYTSIWGQALSPNGPWNAF